MSLRLSCFAIAALSLCSCASHQGCYDSTNQFHAKAFAPTSITSTSKKLSNCRGMNNTSQKPLNLAKMCSFEKGMFAGEHGKDQLQSCSGPGFSEYHHGYHMGEDVFETNQRLEKISSELESTRHLLWKINTSDTPKDEAELAKLQKSIQRLEQARRDESSHLISLRAKL